MGVLCGCTPLLLGGCSGSGWDEVVGAWGGGGHWGLPLVAVLVVLPICRHARQPSGFLQIKPPHYIVTCVCVWGGD